jgi:hypothetical protein
LSVPKLFRLMPDDNPVQRDLQLCELRLLAKRLGPRQRGGWQASCSKPQAGEHSWREITSRAVPQNSICCLTNQTWEDFL